VVHLLFHLYTIYYTDTILLVIFDEVVIYYILVCQYVI